MLKNRYKKADVYEKAKRFRMTIRDWRQALNSSPAYRISNSTLRFQIRFVTIITVLGLAALIFTYNEYSGSMTALNEVKKYSDYNRTYPLTSAQIQFPNFEFQIGLVADLDKASKQEKNSWISYFLTGTLIWNSFNKTVTTRLERKPGILKSSYALAGRGAELSELIVFNGRLLTFDDRTGIVYEIKDGSLIPWVILTDGNGKVNKGFKAEWATVKDNLLYVGSMGKEWTTAQGVYVNHNPMWIKVIYPSGEVVHLDWESKYLALRKAVHIDFPGYMIHEAGVWSSIHRKWFFLPRRSSRSAYDEVADEYRGTNILLTANADFEQISVKYIGSIIPTRGFSSFKFIPLTSDNVIVALKSEEYNGTSASYITAFTIDGQILLPDTKISNLKYEGLEFI